MPAHGLMDRARARGVVEELTRKVLASAAARRQGEGHGEGARSPLALGQPRRRLEVLTERRFDPSRGEDGEFVRDPVTPLGYRTATRALPPVLAGLDDTDPRRRVALMLADTAERIDSVKGVDLAGGDHSGGPSDGGATTRVKHASRLRRIEALANGWRSDPYTGRVLKGPERIALDLGRPSPKRQPIKAYGLLWAVCVEGRDMREVLTAHGWSAQSRDRRRLTLATLDLLAEVSEGLGLGGAPREGSA